MNKLNAIIGYGKTIEDAIQTALDRYNEIDARKTFHKTDIRDDLVIIRPDYTITARVILWFTIQEDTLPVQVAKFIGSQGVDPNDPEWRTKLQNASVALPEAPGTTES